MARSHGTAEKALEASGVAWTHLRPHFFMQNLLGSAGTIACEGRIYSCTGEGSVPHIDVRDIASVAVACVTSSGHEGKSYDLTGPEALSMNEVAAWLGAVLGRRIDYVDIPVEA